MKADQVIIENLKLAEECFQDARITDDLRPASIKKYASSIKKFFTVISGKKVEDLTNADFDQFIIQMKENGASNSRIAHIIASVKWLITRLQGKGIAFNDLNLLSIRKPKASKQETDYLTETEIRQFLEGIGRDIARRKTVKNVRFMALALLLIQTGARIGEALSIDMGDIDRQNKEISIIGKGGKPRKLFLRDETLQAIDAYLLIRADSEKALFATQDGRSRWQQTDVGRSFRRFKKLSGIQKHFVIHTLRHTFATQYLMKGAGINVVQTALGHADPVTTLKYYAAAVEGAKVREMINDRHFDFIPDSVLPPR
ncbi:MAG: tyrosine-type recombinase/integrase [Nitrospirae bacterium]|nr:tyrosine-type recombinase/integrase [Nitrospirota bacterium]